MKNKHYVKMLVLLVFHNQSKQSRVRQVPSMLSCTISQPVLATGQSSSLPEDLGNAITAWQEFSSSSHYFTFRNRQLLWDSHTATEADVQTEPPKNTVYDLRGSNQTWHNLSNLNQNKTHNRGVKCRKKTFINHSLHHPKNLESYLFQVAEINN